MLVRTDAPQDDEIEHERARAIKASAGEIRRVLDEGYRLEDAAGTAGSVTGAILERSRLGLSADVCEWARHAASEEVYARRALHILLRKAIPALPMALIRLSLTPVGWVKYERLVREADLLKPVEVARRQGGLCLEGLPGGGLCRRPIEPGEYSCAHHRDRVADLKTGGMTARGEVWLRRPKPADFPSGEAEPGYEVVQGRRDVFPSYRVMAEALLPEWDYIASERRHHAGPGRATPALEQLENAADSARVLLGEVKLTAAFARMDMGLRGDGRDERKVKYQVERAFDGLRHGEILRLLLGRER